MSDLSLERGYFTNDIDYSPQGGLRCLGMAVQSVLIVPFHEERTHLLMKAENIADPLPLQPPQVEIASAVTQKITESVDTTQTPRFQGSDYSSLAAALIQFTDHVPLLRPKVETPYSHIESLYDEVVDRAKSDGPLTLADQLEISLDQNDNQLPDALWQLFMASRFYARRRDGLAMPGIPVLTDSEKLEMMVAWQNSLAAFTEYEVEGYQDAAGDTYYSWTLALAKVSYSQLPERQNAATKSASKIFNYGAHIMQAYVNTLYKEGSGATNRDHLLAASYGNVIGQACVDAWNAQSAET